MNGTKIKCEDLVSLNLRMADHLVETGLKIRCMVLGCISGPMKAYIPAATKTILNTAMENISGLPETHQHRINIKVIGRMENSTGSAV